MAFFFIDFIYGDFILDDPFEGRYHFDAKVGVWFILWHNGKLLVFVVNILCFEVRSEC